MSYEPKPQYQQQTYTAQPHYNNGIASHTPPAGDQQYTGVVYDTPQNPQLQYQQTQHTGQQYTQSSTHQLSHQDTMSQQIQPINIQPDPLPKALQPQVNAVTPQQVQSAYNNASWAYVPRLTSQDDFHETMCGCCADFFTCKNMNTCCCGMWCPCVLYSRVHYRLRARNPNDLNGFSSCNGQCWMSYCFGWTIHSRQRDELRHRYRVNGSCCGDCLRHLYCSPCSLCQEEKEIKYREQELESLISAGAYQGGPQMVYPGLQNQKVSTGFGLGPGEK